jgi:V8-like Glu-specific endopeptidase
MQRKLRILTVLSLFVILSVLVSTAAQAQATPTANPAAQAGVVSKVVTEAQQVAALKFWTREAVAAAKPLPVPTDSGAAVVDAAADQEALVGAPGFAPSGAAAPGSLNIARQAYAEDWAIARQTAAVAQEDEALAGPEGSSQVFTSYMVNGAVALQTMYPHRWVGRLSFNTGGGTAYCSATAISGNVMLTAAHCLFDTSLNKWYGSWVFQPAYRNGSAPFGSFTAKQCWVLQSWVDQSGSFSINGWTKYDIGVCKMNNNSAGQSLNAAVGWMGRQWNWPYIRHFHDMGYPFRDTSNNLLPNAGLYLRTCVGESFTQTTDTRGVGCNLGPGISGGPWITGYAINAVTGWADGVNSGMYIGTKNMYGARFTSNNIVVLCGAAVC